MKIDEYIDNLKFNIDTANKKNANIIKSYKIKVKKNIGLISGITFILIGFLILTASIPTINIFTMIIGLFMILSGIYMFTDHD